MSSVSESSVEESDSMYSDVSPAPPSHLHDVEIIEIDSSEDDGYERDDGRQAIELDDGDSEEQDSEIVTDNEFEARPGFGDDASMEDEEDEEDEEVDADDEDEESCDAEEDEESVGDVWKPNGVHHNGINGTAPAPAPVSHPSKLRTETITLSETPEPPLLLPTGVKDALHPLQHTADRVVKQIEAYAQSLDNFRRQGLQPGDTRAFQEACKLVKKYQQIAEDTAKELSQPTGARKSLRSSTLVNLSQSYKPNVSVSKDEEASIRRWQLEADTWGLVFHLLAVGDPELHMQAQLNQKTALQTLHRYSTDHDIWETFLRTDHFAVENAVMLKWLENTARAGIEVMDSMISKLEMDANRGEGLWAHGWLYTKEAIKGAKRLRSWPQPLEPDDPSVTASLLSSSHNEPLITQLDPDAVTRQGLGLQKQDQSFEEATWLECWKMIRTGKDWLSIREWAKERLESWRAISLCGSAGDSSLSAKDPSHSSLLRMMNYRSQESWRAACSVLANNPNSNRYERAVYALISGETGPAYEVCQSWSDFVYVNCNHILLSRYRDFCKQLQRKLSYAPKAEVELRVDPPQYDSIRNFLDTLVKDPRTAKESKNPYCTIQAAILGQSYDQFFNLQANALAKVAQESGEPTLIPDISSMRTFDQLTLIAAKDNDSLRLTAHLYLILRAVGLARSDSHYSATASVNVVRPGKIGHIMKGFISKSKVSPEDENLIRCIDWHRYISGQWSRICILGTHLYKRFITAGKISTAREMYKRAKLHQTLVDMTNRGQGPLLEPLTENGVSSPTSDVTSEQQKAKATEKLTREQLLMQAETMLELEQLIQSFDAIEKWGDLMDDYTNCSDATQKPAIKKKLHPALDAITHAIEPLCTEWLIQPIDDAEAKELAFIRSTYLPEIILAYHTALYYAGHILGREILAQCMTLATVVSSSAIITESFMASGRMGELVDALTLSSFAMMGTGQSKLKRKLPNGGTNDIWRIRPIELDENEEDGQDDVHDDKKVKLNGGENGVDGNHVSGVSTPTAVPVV
ncbi:nuclear pore complex protein Nup107 [Trichophyton equinum CBS 127.97]|uniref:Nuclear pore complex protein n=1 Tax=Trichophyton equinum (strain ATCC MYA-4606 / CBS 127.97) TaxID=559882 RepID=F2PMW9_TRIEC|nr:nuclear pore complex protein Nup107 [Trichophyton equinum CBS 127.97]